MKEPHRKIVLLTLIYFGAFCSSAIAQLAFQCTGDFYLSLSSSQGSDFYTISVNATTGAIVFNNFGSGQRINATGYRSTDNLIYGVNPQSPHELFQLDATGNLFSLGNLSPTTNYRYFAGDVTPNGQSLVLLGDGGDVLSTVDLSSGNFEVTTQTMTTRSGRDVFCTDIAFDPLSGELFGFDSQFNRLVKIDQNNNIIEDDLFPVSGTAAAIGALFFDSFGSLWGYGNEQENTQAQTLFKINITTGVVTPQSTGPPSPGKDGCSCPYSVKLQKTVSPPIAFPCTTVEYAFYISNLTSAPQSEVIFEDILPVGFTINEIIRNPFGGHLTSIPGSNEIRLEQMTLPIGVDSLIIRVDVGPDASGIINNQARLLNLPEVVGNTVLSDDPMTLVFGDSTALLVEPLMIELNYDDLSLCPGESLLLDASTYGVDYNWNDGSAEPSLLVMTGGIYSVTISSGCDVAIDSVRINEGDQFLDLGPDISLELGDSVSLDPQYFGFVNPVFSWQTDRLEPSFCVDCPAPTVRPFFNTTYVLELAEPSGCGQIDSVQVIVIKNRDLYVPNAFSPNGDGVNDRFFVQSKFVASTVKFEVFNRWGALVFSEKNRMTNDTRSGWDGYFKNEMVSNGVYIWYAEIEFLDGEKILINGDVTVLK